MMPPERLSWNGGMNSDDDPRFFQPGDYLFALNGDTSLQGLNEGGDFVRMKGNVEINYPLPQGTNRCIGSYKFTTKDDGETILYFVYNSNAQHLVLRYYPNVGTAGEIQLIAKDPTFNFQLYKFITWIGVVGDVCYWTDTFNHPQRINFKKANKTGKKEEHNFYFPEITLGQRQVLIQVLKDGVQQGSVVYNYVGNDINEFARGLAALSWHGLDAISCGKYIELTATTTGHWTFIISVFRDGFAPNYVNTTGYFQAQNYYEGITRAIIDDVPYPPICNPTCEYDYDNTRTINRVERKTFQFALRYHYDDGENSRCSPLSKVPVDGTDCSGVSQNNYILVSFPFPELANPITLCRIIGVELFFRASQTGEYNSIKILGQEDFILNPSYKFYNDEIYSVLSPEESSTLFDVVPLQAAALAFANDEANFRKFYGGLLDGYDSACPDVKVDLTFSPFEGLGGQTGKVTMRIAISNGFASPVPFPPTAYVEYQPIGWYENGVGSNPGYHFGGLGSLTRANNVGTDYGQWIPAGGFILYSAGTPYLAISRQRDNGLPLAPGTTTNVYDMSSTSFRNGVRNQLESLLNLNNVVSDIELELPPGWHILRFASHKCSFGDVLGLGSAYDLNDTTGLGYQKTSTNVIMMDGIYQTTEIRVFIPPTGGVFNLSDARIADQVEPGIFSASIVFNGYLFDNGGFGDQAGPNPTIKLTDSLSMERQIVYFELFDNLTLLSPALIFINVWMNLFVGLDDGAVFTDHNGYFFYATTATFTPLLRMRISATGVTGVPGATATFPATFGITGTTINANGATVIKGPNDPFYTGLLSGTLTPTGTPWIGVNLEEYPVILYCTDTDVSETIKTTIKGFVKDQNGAAINNVAVILANGRFDFTDTNGEYNLVAYGDAVWDILAGGTLIHNNRIDRLYFNYSGVCSITIPDFINLIPNNAQLINIYQFEQGLTYSQVVPFNVADVIGYIGSGGVIKTIRRGSKHNFLLIYYDHKNESTTGGRCAEVYIPDYTEDVNKTWPYQYPVPGTYEYGRPTITLTINNSAPIPEVGRFTHYQILTCEDLITNKYLEWVANQIIYASGLDPTTNQPIPVSYISGQAEEIYISLANIKLFKNLNTDSLVGDQWGDTGYTFTPGDRIKILADENGVFYSEEDSLDVPVKGMQGSNVIIEAINSLPELKQGLYFRLYTPSKIFKKIFYEIGECFEINDPYGTTPTHSQTVIPITGIDCYYFNRLVPAKITGQPTRLYRRKFEDASMSDFYASTHADFGRPNVDEKSEQLEKTPIIRWSQPYLENSKINGLSTFNRIDFTGTSVSYGGITGLLAINNIMLILCKERALSAGIGKAVMQTQDGTDVLTKTNGVIGTINELQGQNGCMDADSISTYNGRAWWWNQFLGIMCQYDLNGINNISGKDMVTGHDAKMQKFFDNVSKFTSKMSESERRIHSWIDPYAKRYYISFENVDIIPVGMQTDNGAGRPLEENPINFPGYTVAYDFMEGRWKFFTSFISEQGSSIGEDFVTMKQGRLYLHNRGLVAGEFYGTKYPSQITLVSKGDHPDTQKVWDGAVEVQGTDLWHGAELSNQVGQVSMLPIDGFKYVNGAWHCPLRRDMNSPVPPTVAPALINGAFLRDHVLFIKFENNSDDPEAMRAAYIKLNKSERTIK